MLLPNIADRLYWAKTCEGTCPWSIQVHVYGRFFRLKGKEAAMGYLFWHISPLAMQC
jgi:hypothetical protein